MRQMVSEACASQLTMRPLPNVNYNGNIDCLSVKGRVYLPNPLSHTVYLDILYTNAVDIINFFKGMGISKEVLRTPTKSTVCRLILGTSSEYKAIFFDVNKARETPTDIDAVEEQVLEVPDPAMAAQLAQPEEGTTVPASVVNTPSPEVVTTTLPTVETVSPAVVEVVTPAANANETIVIPALAPDAPAAVTTDAAAVQGLPPQVAANTQVVEHQPLQTTAIMPTIEVPAMSTVETPSEQTVDNTTQQPPQVATVQQVQQGGAFFSVPKISMPTVSLPKQLSQMPKLSLGVRKIAEDQRMTPEAFNTLINEMVVITGNLCPQSGKMSDPFAGKSAVMPDLSCPSLKFGGYTRSHVTQKGNKQKNKTRRNKHRKNKRKYTATRKGKKNRNTKKKGKRH